MIQSVSRTSGYFVLGHVNSVSKESCFPHTLQGRDNMGIPYKVIAHVTIQNHSHSSSLIITIHHSPDFKFSLISLEIFRFKTTQLWRKKRLCETSQKCSYQAQVQHSRHLYVLQIQIFYVRLRKLLHHPVWRSLHNKRQLCPMWSLPQMLTDCPTLTFSASGLSGVDTVVR